MGLLDDIKNQVKKSGTNKGKFLYFKAGTKMRVRFLNDMEDGLKITFHDSYAKGVNSPCQKYYDRECKYCDEEDIRTRENFAWSVWDHEAKEVKVLMAPVNSFTAIPALIAMYDTYGTLTDRDYVITKNGQGQSSSFSVVPMDKSKFTNEKAKPFTKTKLLDMIDKAFSEYSDDDKEDEKTKASSKKKPAKVDLADKNAYSEYETRELYQLCVERGVEAEKKKPKKYYIDLLEQDDLENEEEEEDNSEPTYNSMTPKELYQLCVKRDIDVEQKKNKEYYIKKLEEADEDDDWGDEDEEDDSDW